MLLAQLEKDQEAVDQVREIVSAEEQVMQRETQIVQDYADVSRELALTLAWMLSLKIYVSIHVCSCCFNGYDLITSWIHWHLSKECFSKFLPKNSWISKT